MDLFKKDFLSVSNPPLAEKNSEGVTEEYLKLLHRFLNGGIANSLENKISDSTIKEPEVIENMEEYQKKVEKFLKH